MSKVVLEQSLVESECDVLTDVEAKTTSFPSLASAERKFMAAVAATARDNRQRRARDIEAELTLYQSVNVAPDVEALEWWRDNHGSFRRLAVLARRYLCVPATQLSCERMFSTAGDIASLTRCSMKPVVLHALLFLQRNFDLIPW